MHLGLISYKMEENFIGDSEKELFMEISEANALLSRKHGRHWAIG